MRHPALRAFLSPVLAAGALADMKGAELLQAARDAAAVAAEDDRAHKDPEPVIVVGDLGASSVDIITRVWCNSGDYWALRWHMLKTVKERFDADGISIPFPQTDVHLYKQDT